MSRIGAVVLGTLCAFVSVELALRAGACIRDGGVHVERLIEERTPRLRGHAVFDPSRTWENTLLIHPFFGYTYNSALSGVNNFGFRCARDFVLEHGALRAEGAEKNALVVGVFGGSFAEGTGDQSAYMEEKLAALFPGRKPIVVNMAIGGHSLPQAGFIFLYFKEMFDIAIFLDGLNEVWNPVENNRSAYPPEYAKAKHIRYMLALNQLTPETFRTTASIVDSKAKLAWLTDLSLRPFVRQSLLFHYCVWMPVAARLEDVIAEQSAVITGGYEGATSFFDVSDREVLVHAAKRWTSHHEWIHEVAASDGILDIHLLQPNPYVRRSKKLTAEEKQAIKLLDVGKYVVAGYPKLQKRLEDLKVSGLVARDLSGAFRDAERTLWIDGAHLNDDGYRSVVDRVCEVIQEHRDEVASRATGNH